jgi:hypothetical protein
MSMLSPPAEAIPAPDPVPDDRREALLREFDLLTEQDLAVLLDVKPKTLRNRPFSDLPEFITVGRRRLFYRKSVAAYLQKHIQRRRARA